jgi:transposase-like protein
VKAYDYARPDIIKLAMDSESPPDRDKRSRLSVAEKQRIVAEFAAGKSKAEIAKAVGCSIQTVYRTLKAAGQETKGRKAS